MKKAIRKMAGLFSLIIGCILLGCLVGWCQEEEVTLCQLYISLLG